MAKRSQAAMESALLLSQKSWGKKVGIKPTETRKSQAAMEFLMTYGWAMLLVLVVIIALSFFGLLDPGKFLGDKCDLGTPALRCTDFTMDGNNITMIVKNSLGKSIYGLNITAIDQSGILSSGSTKRGSKARFSLNVTYNTSEAGRFFPHAATGKLIVSTTSAVTGHAIFSTTSAYGTINGKRAFVWGYVPAAAPEDTMIVRLRFG